MPQPTFVQEAEPTIGWTSESTTTRTTATMNVLVGDVLVLPGVTEDFGRPITSVAGGSLVWTPEQRVQFSGYTEADIWSSVATSATGFAVTATCSGGAIRGFGVNGLVFRNSAGKGASSQAHTTGAPSLNLTTTQANSAIVVAIGDWSASDGASRTWRTVNSMTPTAGNGYELTYFRDASFYAVYIGYYPDVGAAGSKTVGLTAPSSQTYSIVALEVKGTAAAGTELLPKLMHAGLYSSGRGGLG